MKSENSEREDILSKISSWRKNKERVVFTNGCFDIIHAGHIQYLNEAKTLGDRLVIGLNSDSSVSRLKGEQRPIVCQEERATILNSLEIVDAVVIFEEDTPLKLIEQVKPNVLVKGGDYTIDEIVGADFVLSKGGDVKTLSFKSDISSSIIIDRIKKLT